MAALAPAAAAEAADLRVGERSRYADLEAALADAAPGDRILIAPGTYTGDHRITVPVEIKGIADGVVLKAESGRVLQLDPTASGTVVTRLTVDGGNGTYGGGALANRGVFTFRRVTFRNGWATNGGGGLACTDADCTVELCEFVDNRADGDGGGLAVYAGTGTVFGSTFQDNVAGSRGGGVVVVESSSLDFASNRLVGNSTEREGAGAVMVAEVADASVRGNTIQANLAATYGSVCLVASAGEVRGNLVEDNFAVGDVGGVVALTSTVNVIGNVIRRNGCGIAGGGIYFINSLAGVIRNNVVYANEAGQTGGGILVEDGVGDVYNNVVAYNTSVYGGGGIMMGRGGFGVVAQNTVYANACGGTNSDGVSAIDGSDLVLWNNVVVFNEDSGIFGDKSRSISVRYNESYGNGSGVVNFGGDAASSAGTSGNVSVDPLMVHMSFGGEATEDDIRPGRGSPLRDAGDPALLDPDGSRSDLGALGGVYGDSWEDLPIRFLWQ